jgi:cell division transport system permease protein
MLTNFNRVFNFALADFFRNKGISLASIFVLFAITILATWLLFFQGMANFLISEIQQKIDVAAYFKEDVLEEDILSVKDQLLLLSSDIKDIEYVSKDEALKLFKERYKDNDIFAKALEEVGQNPFLPSLNIRTSGNPDDYEKISEILETSDFSKLIDRVDFSQKKDTIEKIYSIISAINKFGLALGLILIIVASVVVFNTIKLAVDASKEEINIMKTVGASHSFVRGPFIILGAIYGAAAFAVSLIISILSTWILSSKISAILPGFSLSGYFWHNFWIFILIQLIFGIGLGAFSSFLAVKRYLKL